MRAVCTVTLDVMLLHSLRAASDEQLAGLLLARRDLATPPPADTDVLARRASSAGSVARACEQLDTGQLAALEALLLLDADSTPVSPDAVSELLGADCTPSVEALQRLALCWGSDGGLEVVAAAREVLGPFPAGLGRSVPALSGVDLGAAVAEVSDEERTLLGKLAAGPPVGRTRDAAVAVDLDSAQTPVQRLLARALLVRRDTETVELPRELGVHLRGGRVFAPSTLHEPELRTNPHAQRSVDQAAAGEAMELCRHAGALLDAWSHAPPPVLKSGGLGVRELRRICRDLDVDEPRAVLLAEVLLGAGLIADSASTSPEFVPTTLADTWLASAPAGRWALLAAAWLELPRLPGLAYAADRTNASLVQPGRTNDALVRPSADPNERPPAPLSDRLHRPTAPAIRRRVLASLDELPPGTGVADAAELVAVLAWRAPRRGGRLRDDAARWVLAEAAALGVTALGALPSATRALLTPPEPDEPYDEPRRRATAALAEALPAPVDHVLVQADLTVVAPGPLEPALADEIAAVADIESAGHATVYRISEPSVRRALDTGRTPAELHELFAQRSRTPVPQSLTYLIDDVARRHGRLRGGAAASFLRADDDVLVAEVLAHPVTVELELRRIAPTVLVSPLPLAEVLDGLRAAGFAPAAEGVDGRVVNLAPRGRRLPARTTASFVQRRRANDAFVRAGGLGSGQSAAEQIAAVVARMRAGDAAAGARRGAGVRNAAGTGDTSATLELLATAARSGRQVWIGYVDANGTAAQRLVTPVRVSAGILDGADDDRYPLHRITSAAYVE